MAMIALVFLFVYWLAGWLVGWFIHLLKQLLTITVNPRFKHQDLINFMDHHLGSNRERGQIETINLSTLLIWMGKLTLV